MADVQLEKGYTRIANRLDEALIVAAFTATQQNIVRCIIRLTWGWQQHTVRISASDLAEKCGLQDSGGFRRDFRSLIKNNVVEEVEAARGRAPSVYRLQKNFEKWGVFSIATSRLEALFAERPPSLNSTRHRVRPIVEDTTPRVTPLSQATEDDFDEEDEASVTPLSHDTDPRSLTPLSHATVDFPKPLGDSMEPAIRLDRVTHDGRKSLKPETYEASKERKDSISSSRKDHITGAGIAQARDHTRTNSTASPTATAVQRFLDARRPETRADWRSELASLEQQYSRELVERVALDCLMADNPPSTPGVFRIFCATTAKDLNGTNGQAKPEPAPRSAAVVPGSAQRERDERELYEAERRHAGRVWSENPANLTAYALLVGCAAEELGPALQFPGGPAIAEQSAVLKAADMAGFPTFADWQWASGRRRNGSG